MFAGCNKDKETQGTTLKASIEQQKGDSKTSLIPTDGAISWTAGDKSVELALPAEAFAPGTDMESLWKGFEDWKQCQPLTEAST